MLFKRDEVLEVALDDKGIGRLYNNMEWGEANGLARNELQLLDKNEVAIIEPNVRCDSALYCSKDASVNYGEFTLALLEDIQRFGFHSHSRDTRSSGYNKIPVKGGIR